jgi:hypothetical protein
MFLDLQAQVNDPFVNQFRVRLTIFHQLVEWLSSISKYLRSLVQSESAFIDTPAFNILSDGETKWLRVFPDLKAAIRPSLAIWIKETLLWISLVGKGWIFHSISTVWS